MKNTLASQTYTAELLKTTSGSSNSHILQIQHVLCVIGVQTWFDETTYQYILMLHDLFRKKPHSTIILVDGCDDVCRQCPYYVNNTCSHTIGMKKIQDGNTRLFAASKLNCGDQYYFDYIIHTLLHVRRRKATLGQCCKHCTFTTQCRFYKTLYTV